MFTGIIRHIGTVSAVRRQSGSLRLGIDAGPLSEGLEVGDSLSVDGVCLTVTERQGNAVACDVGAETLDRSTLGGLRRGEKVNLEPALRVGYPLGGHFVSGHVDGTGTIRAKEERPGEVRLTVEVVPELGRQMIQKGSVAVDGISLTVARLESARFEASIIPHTLAATTLQFKGAGDPVNIECDVIGRWVRRLLGEEDEVRSPGALDVGKLEEQGF